MALPQDGVNANALAKVTTIPTGKELIFIDPTTNEGGVITLEDLTKQILQNLTSQTFTLDQGTKTLPAALNELNSKTSSAYFNFEDVGKRSILDVVKSKNSGIFLLYTQDALDSPAIRNVSFTIVNKPAADYIYLYLYVYNNIYFATANTKTDVLEWKRITTN